MYAPAPALQFLAKHGWLQKKEPDTPSLWKHHQRVLEVLRDSCPSDSPNR